MHIAFVNLLIEYYSPQTGGAISTCIMQQAKRLIARGHEVSVLTRVGKGETYDVGRVVPVERLERHELSPASRAVSKVKYRLNHWDWPYYNHYTSSVSKALRRLRPVPDVLICFNDLHLQSHVRQILPKAKVVVYLQNEAGTRRRDLGRLVSDADLFVCVSGYVRDRLLKSFPVPNHKAVVLLNGADPSQFYSRDEFLASRDHVRALYVGRVNYEKAPDVAVQAVRQVRAEGRDVRLTAAGSVWWYGTDREMQDPYFRQLAASLEQVGAERLGHVDRIRMPEIFRQADVVIVPSRWNDPCPLVIAEAMLSGCAVIASDRGGIAEACGEAALLADPDNPETFATALRTLVDDPTMLAEWKQRSVARARDLTWDRNVDTLLSLLESDTSASRDGFTRLTTPSPAVAPAAV